MFDSKQLAEQAAMIARYQADVDHCREENAYLRKQVEKLQEALFARESPQAYAQMKMDEVALDDDHKEMSEEELKRRKVESEILTRRMYNTEKSFLEIYEEDPEALTTALLRQIGAPVPQSLHKNDES
jgi:hypothetical protein